jgi:hypothetical protein
VIASQDDRQESYAAEEEDAIKRMMEMAGINNNTQLDEGIMDKIKGLVPRLMQMLGADTAAEIAKQVKQVTGGNYSLNQDNAVKVAQAFGFDKMQPEAGDMQASKMTEGIAGNWQGKLIQLLHAGGVGAGLYAGLTGAGGPFAGRFVAVIGMLLLLFTATFWSSERGMVGAMGRDGRKGTDTGETYEQTDLDRMMEMAGVKKKAVDEEKTDEGNLFTKGLADDNVKVGDKIPGTNAVKKKDIDESIFAMTANLWKTYKG